MLPQKQLKIEAEILAVKIQQIPFTSLFDHFGIPYKQSSAGRFVSFCPFHSETKESFLIGGKGNFGYCFGCGKGWDHLQFVKDLKKTSIEEAIKILVEIGSISADAAVIKTLSRDVLGIWKKAAVEKQQVEQEVFKGNEKIILSLADRFSTQVHSGGFQHELRYFIDHCWDEYDTILKKGATVETVDEIKDWFHRNFSQLCFLQNQWKNFAVELAEFRNSIVEI